MASSLPVSPLHLPATFNFATNIVEHWAQQHPSQIALYWTNQSLSVTKKLTYGHFARQSQRIAALFQSLGVKQGETAIVIAPRLPEWWEIGTACLRSGVLMCPCTMLLVDKDIEYRLQVSRATTFIGDETAVAKCLKVREKCPNLRHVIQIEGNKVPEGVISFHHALSKIPLDATFPVPQSLGPKSPALVFFTSGTTGPPKMVLHTQTSYPLAHALTGTHWLDLSPSKTYWNLSEQGWAKAAWSWFSAWICGATLFVHDDRLPFMPRRTIEVLHKFPITTLCAPPTVYRQLVLEENRRLFAASKPRVLTHCAGAGEPLNESVIRKWREMTGGIEIFDAYGQTETVVLCANQKVNPVKPGSMGKPIPGVAVTLVDTEGNIAQDNVEGDIAVSIPESSSADAFFGFFQGYIDMATGKLDHKIKTFANGKKFFLTGDRATRDEDGYFWFVGRSDDVINSAGYRIGPFEVESTLNAHPSVAESAVVASPDAARAEVVKAFVVLTASAAASLASSASSTPGQDLVSSLQEYCKRNAAPYKYPRLIEFVDPGFLPKTISGKIKRAELKAWERKRVQEMEKKGGVREMLGWALEGLDWKAAREMGGKVKGKL